MTAMGQVHSHDDIPGVQKREVDSHVGLGTGVGLHIGIGGPKQGFRPFNGEVFSQVHFFTSTVIPFARVSFRIFIGEHAALGSHNSGGW